MSTMPFLPAVEHPFTRDELERVAVSRNTAEWEDVGQRPLMGRSEGECSLQPFDECPHPALNVPVNEWGHVATDSRATDQQLVDHYSPSTPASSKSSVLTAVPAQHPLGQGISCTQPGTTPASPVAVTPAEPLSDDALYELYGIRSVSASNPARPFVIMARRLPPGPGFVVNGFLLGRRVVTPPRHQVMQGEPAPASATESNKIEQSLLPHPGARVAHVTASPSPSDPFSAQRVTTSGRQQASDSYTHASTPGTSFAESTDPWTSSLHDSMSPSPEPGEAQLFVRPIRPLPKSRGAQRLW